MYLKFFKMKSFFSDLIFFVIVRYNFGFQQSLQYGSTTHARTHTHTHSISISITHTQTHTQNCGCVCS